MIDKLLPTDKIVFNKINKTIDLLCLLYEQELITNSVIVGSVAKGTATEFSDIDIYLINPNFQWFVDLKPTQSLQNTYIRDLVEYLKSLGMVFELVHKNGSSHWNQYYKGEYFHLMTDIGIEKIRDGDVLQIGRDFCTE